METADPDFDAEAEMVEYYSRLAPRYESKKGVGVPPSEEYLAYVQRLLPFFTKDLAGRDVLEVACGPGTWTHRLAPFVNSILAVDINESTLVEARKKSYPEGKVRFLAASAYTLDGVSGTFNAAFAKDWCSHIPKPKVREFLKVFHSKLQPGARVVLADSWFPNDTTRPKFSHIDADGNVYVWRKIPDAPDDRRWRVIKNCPTEADWRAHLEGGATDIEYQVHGHDWRLAYTLRG
ncbi:MAG TPA: class I SAM-dependent methyltransferase [Planctomycetota bacterium]|nr:class I SAM-dependent methyltransferase [Planctomycetota bacterium]